MPCKLRLECDNVSGNCSWVSFFNASIVLSCEPGYFYFLPVPIMCLIVLTGFTNSSVTLIKYLKWKN